MNAQDRIQTRQIVGLSLAPKMAKEVKMEAARRGIPLKKLFEEMWLQYQKNKKRTDDAR